MYGLKSIYYLQILKKHIIFNSQLKTIHSLTWTLVKIINKWLTFLIQNFLE